MGGFKRILTSSTNTRRSAAQSGGSGRSTRSSNLNATVSGRGGRGGARGRGRGRRGANRTVIHEEEDDQIPRPNRHEYFEEDDDEDEIQGEYREAGGTMVGDIYIPPPNVRVEPQLTGERLVIHKIVCENFKSYGGLKCMGPFHKSFSSIIGPNGNGKSNMIDAMLFVFGYKASKIRCKKVSVLIHKSELLPSLTSCAVTVHFVKIIDNGADDDKFEIVPNSEIRVKRRADIRNNSTYYYNDRPVKFQEVAEFLKAAGIDIVHNRFLILQGEVEQISQMPPKRKNQHETGLLEFLEEVIGTKRYLKCLSQLDGKVEELNFTREGKLQYVDIVECERRALEEPANKAKEYLRKQNTLARYEHTNYQIKILKTQNESKELTTGLAEVQGNYDRVTGRLNEINSISKERDSAYFAKEKETKDLEAEFNLKKEQVREAEAKFLKTQEQIKRSNTQRKKIIEDISKTEKDLETLELLPENHQKDLDELTKKRDELEVKSEKEGKAVEGQLTKLQAQIDAVSKEKEKADHNFLQLKKVRDEKRSVVQKLESELKVYKEQEGVEQRKLDTLQEEFRALQERVKIKEREARSSMGDRIGPMEVSVQQKETELQATIAQERQRKIEVDNLRAQVDSAKEAMDCSPSNDNIYKAFFNEKKKGRFEGLHGRLKDLATIDEKYNVAITVSTSLWENWVVDTDTTAEECIKFLKEKGLQFQNFLPLNKLKHYDNDMRRPFTPPRNSQRLFDLLQFNRDDVGVAFYKGLRNTLVADNLDIAQPIAYGAQKHRIATLTGELIDPSGQMTGGGREKIIGKMNSRTANQLGHRMSDQDYQNLIQECQQANSVYEELCTKRQTLENEIRTIHTKLKEYKSKVDSSKSDIESARNQIRLKETRIQEQEALLARCKTDSKVLKKKEKDCEKAQEDYDEANGPCEQAQEIAQEVEEKLKSLQVDRRKEIRKKLDSLLEQKKKVIAEIDKLNVELKNFEKNKAKLTNKIQSLKTEKEKLENKMRDLAELKNTLADEGTEIARSEKELAEKLEESKKVLHELKKTLSEFGGEKVKLDKEKVKLENELTNFNTKLEKYNSKISRYQSEMSGLSLDEIPGEEVEKLITYPPEELQSKNVKELEFKIVKLKEYLQSEQPNLGVLEQYKIKTKEFLEKVKELDAVTLERDKYREAYLQATKDRLSEFMSGFATISSKLKEMFRMISMGGDAELELCDSSDPFSFGIEMSVRPARKTWKKISFLSGGEKTLSSLALVFALHHFKPSPFYVMDEIDAALDFKNVSIIANYIKDRTKFTQFIIISLRANMFELADCMLGVYKVDNMSYSIHLGVGTLLKHLREKFLAADKVFPFEIEYQQNNRQERRKDMEKIMERNKVDAGEEPNDKPAASAPAPDLFNAGLSHIQEDSVLSQPVARSGDGRSRVIPDDDILTPEEREPTDGETGVSDPTSLSAAGTSVSTTQTQTTEANGDKDNQRMSKRQRSPIPPGDDGLPEDEMNESKRSRISDAESEDEDDQGIVDEDDRLAMGRNIINETPVDTGEEDNALSD